MSTSKAQPLVLPIAAGDWSAGDGPRPDPHRHRDAQDQVVMLALAPAAVAVAWPPSLIRRRKLPRLYPNLGRIRTCVNVTRWRDGRDLLERAERAAAVQEVAQADKTAIKVDVGEVRAEGTAGQAKC